MKHTLKTALALLLVLSMLLSLCGVMALAEDSYNYGEITVTGESTVTGLLISTIEKTASHMETGEKIIPTEPVTVTVTVSDGISANSAGISDAACGIVIVAADATVTVNGDVSASSNFSADGVSVNNIGSNYSATVTVNGNVSIECGNGNGDGVFAQCNGNGDAVINVVGGDVTAEGVEADKITGVSANGGTVNVSEKDGKGGSVTSSGNGVTATDDSEVKVGHDVVAGDDGIIATDSTVTVDGSVYAECGSGVSANNSTVEVGGGVSAGGNGVTAENSSEVTVENGVIASRGDGVTAKNSSEVTVGSYIVAADDGIIATDSTVTVTVSVSVIAAEGGVNAAGSTGTAGAYVSAMDDGISATDSTVTVEGNVSAGGDGINASAGSGKETIVTVEGTVTAGGDGIIAEADGGTVIVTAGSLEAGGETAVSVSVTPGGGIAEVTVGDETDPDIYVNASDKGVVADNDSNQKVTVTVSTDVTAETGVGVEAENSSVTVEGDVTGKTAGVSAADGSTVMVNGDVTGETTGISVEIASGDSASSIVVEGTVSGGNAITLNIGDDVDTGTVINAIPEIIVQTLDSDADLVAVVGADADAETLTQQVLDKVRYIVDTEVDKSALTENLTVEIYRLDENGQRAELDTEGVTGKELTVASTGMKLIIGATSGSLAGVVVDTDNPNNTVTYNEAAGTYEIIVGIGGGLKFTATPKKPEPEPKPEPVPEPKPEPVPAQQTAAVPSSYAETKPVYDQQTALVTLDYRNHLLIIDMTKTAVQTFLADTLRRFHMYNGFDIAIIKVANGSFTVDMADLLELLGHAPSLTLKVSGDTLAILVDGAEVAMLVMA